MEYAILKELFKAANAKGEKLEGFILFSADSFNKMHTKEQRCYFVTSDNKAFIPNASGYSIFGACADGKDIGVRLDAYMQDERGGENGWTIEDCGLVQYALLECFERDIKVAGVYNSKQVACDEMLSRMADTFECEKENIQPSLEEGWIEGALCEDSEWANDVGPHDGNCDWKIERMLLGNKTYMF